MPPDPTGMPRGVSSHETRASLQGPGAGHEDGADRYLSWLDSCIASTAADVPDLIPSAEAAAARYVCDGEQLGITGDEGLVSEAYGRSGGFMRLSRLIRRVPSDWHGIVLCFPREWRLARDFEQIRRLLKTGRHVVVFVRRGIRARAEAASVRPHAWVNCHARAEGGLFQDAGGHWLVPTSPAASIVALWSWLGEFVAACTRLGRMPVMYESFDVPGARQRPERLRGLKFHAEPPVPMAAGHAANAYLKELTDVVGRFRSAERQNVRQAAAIAAKCVLVGRRLYVFPHNHTLLHGRIGGPHDPGHFKQLNRDWFRVRPMLRVDRGDLVLCIGYSRIYAGSDFSGFADAMRARGVLLIWSLATYNRDPLVGTAGILGDEMLIDQHWRCGDAVVECPGYDIRILPTSGVMAETVMWSVVSDMLVELRGQNTGRTLGPFGRLWRRIARG